MFTLLSTTRQRIFALGMMYCGYAAGQRNGEGWTGPWWGTMLGGLTLVVVAFIAELRYAKRDADMITRRVEIEFKRRQRAAEMSRHPGQPMPVAMPKPGDGV